MSDTVRQLIIENLLTRFTAIDTSTGYSVKYKLVAEWNQKPINNDDPTEQIPAIIIEDPDEQTKRVIDTQADHTLSVNIYIVVAQNTAPEALRNHISDVFKCLGEDRTCGGYADDITPDGNEMMLDLEDLNYGVIKTKWLITYSTAAWDLTINLS